MKHEFMSHFMAYVKAKIRLIFGIKGPVLVDDAPITMPIERKRRKKVADEERNEVGVFRTFGDLLDQLDEYFFYLNLLKRNDPDSYNFFKSVGGQISPKNTVGHSYELASIWKTKNKPSHGMMFVYENKKEILENEKNDRMTPKLLYFRKVNRTPYCQPFKGDIYAFTEYYADKNQKKPVRVPIDWYVGVDKDGNFMPLKRKNINWTSLPIKGNKTQRNSTSGGRIPKDPWGYGENVDRLIPKKLKNGMTNVDAMNLMFSIIANISTYANDGVRINVEKDGVVGVFNIPMTRTAFFFKDREKIVNENGQTKRIFHVTGAHMRTRSDGTKTPVRLHFRGLRKFNWKGYKITITVDGLHHASLINMDLGVHEMEDNVYDKKEWLNSKQVGEKIKQVVMQ